MKSFIVFVLLVTSNQVLANKCLQSCDADLKSCLKQVEADREKINVAMSLLESESKTEAGSNEVIANLKKSYAEEIKLMQDDCAIDKKDCIETCKK